MDKIEVAVLNPREVQEAEKNMVFAARLTQRGHQIKNMEDLKALYNKPYLTRTAKAIYQLPHPTLLKLNVINVAIVGASRRFLAQITRHQNEVKFVSASMQYSDYSGEAAFAVPYEILVAGEKVQALYLESCEKGMECYEELIGAGIAHDSAGYSAANGLRNVLIISATPYQWRHMIGQRVCGRNTDETRIVMLKIWQELYMYDCEMFAPETTGPACQREGCAEGKMSCGETMEFFWTPEDIMAEDYPALCNIANEDTSD